jgi:hypothetical protein
MSEWVKKNVELEIKLGRDRKTWLVKIVDKNGGLRRYLLSEVKEHWGEKEEEKKEEIKLDW